MNMSKTFDKSAKQRLKLFLKSQNLSTSIEQLTPDASTREFFRIEYEDKLAIACIYPEQFNENLPQIDITNLFLKSELPVAKIFNIDFELGIIIHEDFGDKILRVHLESCDNSEKELLIENAISLIAYIQKSTSNAVALDSIAAKLKFDEEKLLWELNFFKTHYFKSLKKNPLSIEDDEKLSAEFTELSKELENYAKVLTHRDFHAANLMLDDSGNLKIIDHQDARLGSIAYDLVSLLLDRITQLPSQVWLKNKKVYFLNERNGLGLENISLEDFDYEFELMTVQRCLKAIGTFSNQAGNFGKSHFIKYINPMFKVVLDACMRLDRFPQIQKTIIEILEN